MRDLGGSDSNCCDDNGNTPLMYGALAGHSKVSISELLIIIMWDHAVLQLVSKGTGS